MTERDEMVALADCPVGLFMSEGGELCLKTEYGNNEGRIDAYIVSSGEFFCGGHPQTVDNQRKQMVRPIDHKELVRSAARTDAGYGAGFEACREARRLLPIMALAMQTALNGLKETDRPKSVLDLAQDSLEQALKIEADFADKELKAIAALPAPATTKLIDPIDCAGTRGARAMAMKSHASMLPAPATVSGGWQPIETAPKDGTEIIVFHPKAGVCAAFCPAEGFAWHCMDGSNTTIGSKSGASIPRMTFFIEAPTHWMPLPAAPTITRKSQSEERS